jgi:hypothetical protein
MDRLDINQSVKRILSQGGNPDREHAYIHGWHYCKSSFNPYRNQEYTEEIWLAWEMGRQDALDHLADGDTIGI